MLLKIGNESPDVLNLERALEALGYAGLEIDGVFDKSTENVIKNIQKTHGLMVDGICGEKTLAVIDRLYEPNKHNFSSSGFVTPAQEDAVVSEIQPILPKSLSGVHPTLAQKAMQMIAIAESEGYTIRVTQGLRTFAEQDALFRKRPKVTNARGGQSYHNYGIAVDFAFVVNGKISWDERLYKNLGRWCSRVGLEWGGNWRFTDLPHCQLPNMTSIKVLRQTYDQHGGGSNGIGAVWRKFVR